MRRAIFHPMVVAAALGGGALVLPGCTADSRGVADHPKQDHATADAAEADRVNANAQDYADRLTGATGHGAMPAGGMPRVHWITTNQTRNDRPAPIRPTPPSTHRPQSAQPGEAAPAEAATADPTPAAQTLALERQELLDLLLGHIRSGNDPAMSKALTAAALSLADPTGELDPALLGPLDRPQRDVVRRYHQLVITLGRQLADGTGTIDSDAIAEQLNHLFGRQLIHIQKVKLCTRVRGYGVYDPIEPESFLAGRENRVIVYVELDHFRSVLGSDGQYEVKLAQQVSLYNEADGLEVWRQPSVQIVDRSRNRRRDFFEVQLIKLPPQLNVGKYRLKVRVTDHHADCIDEASIPIRFVADQALVGRK